MKGSSGFAELYGHGRLAEHIKPGTQRVMEMKLTTMSENTAGGLGFLSEWGLSIPIHINEFNVLFDTGFSFAAVRNADKLRVDLRSTSKLSFNFIKTMDA